jgi:SAM-dependent methyltransferase
MTFTYHGVELAYHDHPYNTTRWNERAVEVPVAELFLAGVTGDGLEVGNVLGHYGTTGHRVVDLYEVADGVDNVDLFDIGDRYDWIVAISTIEHVYWDHPAPREPTGALRALKHLCGLLRPGGRMLVTVPMGHHAHLDPVLMAGQVGAVRDCTMVRDGDGWRQTDERVWEPYGKSTMWAESVWLGEFVCESTP